MCDRSLVTDRAQWERTSTKLQAALHETVQLTARLQAARAELEAERRLTAQMKQRLHEADAHMKVAPPAPPGWLPDEQQQSPRPENTVTGVH